MFDIEALGLHGRALQPVDETVSPSRALGIKAHGRRGAGVQWAGSRRRVSSEALVLCLQMQLQQGVVAVSGTLAYVSQQAWIFHGSVRENILFGAKYDHQRYRSRRAGAARPGPSAAGAYRTRRHRHRWSPP